MGLIAIGIAALVFKYALKNKFEDEFKNVLLKDIKAQYQGAVAQPNAFTVAADIFQVYVSHFLTLIRLFFLIIYFLYLVPMLWC